VFFEEESAFGVLVYKLILDKKEMMELVWLPPLLGVVGIIIAALIYSTIVRRPVEPGKAHDVAEAIHRGAQVFLRREYSYLASFVFIVFLVIGFLD